MAQIGSFALLFALVCSAYCVVAGIIAIVSKKAFAMPLGETAPRAGIATFACSKGHVCSPGFCFLVPPASGNQPGASMRIALVVFLLTSFTVAQTLTGTVRNSTTGKPSAGDEVVIFKLSQGMEESGRTKTNAEGQFSFTPEDPQAPYLVRAIHQGVTYHRMAPHGTKSVAIDVYDAAKKIEEIEVVADIMRIQAAQGQIVVTREFGVRNSSDPPRTQMNERDLEFYIPDSAHIIGASAASITENGNPLKSAPVPEGGKNRYSFVFPLRPGLTRFEVTYQLPYSGKVDLDPKSIYPLEHFVVVLPKTMQFKAVASSTPFKVVNFPNQPDASVQVASNTSQGQDLAFNISGEGKLESGQQLRTQRLGAGEQSSAGDAPGAQSKNRPGGGLGPPIDAPDPLQKYRWWILSGSAAVLLIGGIYVASRQPAPTRAFRHRKHGSAVLPQKQQTERSDAGISVGRRAPVAARPISKLLLGIREKLFQIEVERHKGQISESEYEKAKSAIDQSLLRALKHEAQKA